MSLIGGFVPSYVRASDTSSLTTIVAVSTIDDLRLVEARASSVFCSGHSYEGDGGQGYFSWEPTSTEPDNGGTIIKARNQSRGRWVRQGSRQEIDVRWFGATGNGITDDTRALELAHSAAATLLNSNGNGSRRAISVYYPAGRYIYRGSGIRVTGGHLSVRGPAPRATVIEIGSPCYFIECDGYIDSTFVSNMAFTGGKGAVRYTRTEANVSGFHSFEHCHFDDYTECAIGNNSVDHPYLKVQFCSFKGNSNSTTIGIAWGGYIDSLTITDTSFLWNTYHLKLGPRISGSVSIQNCDFIKWTKAPRTADIWIVPNTSDKHGVNSGGGIVISQNKFGNENQAANESRILIALEKEGGKDRLGKHHSDSWTPSSAFVQGVVIKENRIDGVSGLTAPFIRSLIHQLRRVDFRDNFLGGGAYTYLCEFLGDARIENESHANRTWNIELGSHSPGIAPFSKAISNQTRGLYDDKFGSMHGDSGTLLPSTTGDDVGYVSLIKPERKDILRNCEVKRVQGSYGSSSVGLDIYFTEPSGSYTARLERPLPHQICWIECDLRQSADVSLTTASLRVLSAPHSSIALREQVALSDRWQTVRIPFVFPPFETTESWSFQVLPGDFENASRRRVSVSRLNIYHARQPMNAGHLRTIGSGSWNEQHIVIGSAHIWLDSQGQLRMKSSAPLYPQDGDLIGGMSR